MSPEFSYNSVSISFCYLVYSLAFRDRYTFYPRNLPKGLLTCILKPKELCICSKIHLLDSHRLLLAGS